MTIFEELLQDYARYSFMEGTIDKNTMNHLIEDAQNYVVKLNNLKLLGLHNVNQRRELFKGFLEKVVEETEVGDLTWQTRDEAKELLKLFNCVGHAVVNRQRELLLAWAEYCCQLEYLTPNYEVLDKNIDDFLEIYWDDYIEEENN